MSTDLTTLRSMRESLQNFRNSIPRAGSAGSGDGGDGFMKFAKGDWTYGRDNAPLDLTGEYLIHPNSLMHGYICWRNGKIFKEVLVPFTQMLPMENTLPVPPAPAPDSGDQDGYQQQYGMKVVALTGKQAGLQLTFKTGTDGGRKAVGAVIDELVARMLDIETLGFDGGAFPVVMFGTGGYKHPTPGIGTVKTPSITVIGWSANDPDGEIEYIEDAEEEEAVQEIAPPPAAPARRRRIAG